MKKRVKKNDLSQKDINYCVRDATITYRTAKLLYKFYDEFQYLPKTTLPSTALHIWKDKFWGRDIELPDDEIIEFARKSFFGGRTEAFAIGEFSSIKVIDAASMYPWAMCNGDLPIPWGTFRRIRNEDMVNAKASGIYHARISSNVTIPALPIRTDEGLIFPNGTFEGYFTGEEIIYAASIGITGKLLSGIEFTDICRPFDSYVETFFKKKQRARGSQRLMYKLMLNSLYGKFSQRGEHIISEPLEEFRELKEPPDDFRIWNGLVLYEEEGSIPPWGNVVWSAIITARARIRLHKEMLTINKKGGRILYCDTDSVTYMENRNTRIAYPIKARIPGEFESRGEYKSIMIVGKKEYALETIEGTWIPYCKGVPYKHREEYLLSGRTTFMRPTKIKESSRTNTTANVWKSVTKERHVNYNKRRRNPDGSLAPIVITNGVIKSGK